MKDLTTEFSAHLDAMRAGADGMEFLEEVDVIWVAGTTSTYSPLDTGGTTQAPNLTDNPYYFEVPDKSGLLKARWRAGGHRAAVVSVRISYDGGINWALDYKGTIQKRADSNGDTIRFYALGIFSGLENSLAREGSAAYQRKHVDANDSFFDEVGKDTKKNRKQLGSS